METLPISAIRIKNSNDNIKFQLKKSKMLGNYTEDNDLREVTY